MRYILVSSAVALFLSAATASAGVVDFEQIPGQSPSDLLVIKNQFLASFGVTFRLEGGGAPRLAKVGGTATAFSSSYGADAPAPGQALGSYFLTDDDAIGPGKPAPILMNFVQPHAFVGGQIIDVDPDEAWLVQALDINGQIIKSARITDAPDGAAVDWSLSVGSPRIASVRIAYDGAKASKVGFAIDGISFDSGPGSAVPEPGAVSLLLIGAMAALRRRR